MVYQRAVRNAVGRAGCNIYRAINAVGGIAAGNSGFSVFPGAEDSLEEWLCDLPGNDEDTGSLTSGNPGLGGQCPALYTVRFRYIRRLSNGGTSSGESGDFTLQGPIEGLRLVTGPGANQSRIEILHNGTFTVGVTEGVSSFQYDEPEFISIARTDGQPDDCGFLQEPEPPEWNDELPPIVPGDPPRPIVIAPSFPIILPGGGLSWPLTVNGPNFNFNTNIRVGGGGGGGGGDCDPVQPVFSPSPTNTQPFGSEQIPEGPNEPPPPEEGESGLIIGCYVSVVGRGDADATVIGGTPGFPELLIPRIGDVSFAVTVEGKNAWTTDIPVKFDKQWIPIPGRLLAYDVRIKPEPGVNALVFPLRVTAEYAQAAGFL